MSTICLISEQERFLGEVNRVLATQYITHCFHTVDTGLASAKKYGAAAILIGLPELLAGGAVQIDKLRIDPFLSCTPLIVVGTDLPSVYARMQLPLPNAVYLQRPFLRSELLATFADLIWGQVQLEWQKLPERPRVVLEKTQQVFSDWQAAVDGGVPLDMETSFQSCAPLIDAIGNSDIVSILDSVKIHHDYTYVHSMRVATYLSIFAHAVGLKGDMLQTVATGGLLHDVGKISTPDEILNKPGRLEGAEWETMKDHAFQSGAILRRNETISTGIRIIAEQHHEKLDGTGYPYGLKGDELSELARMSTIADIFSALTDERTYKKALSLDKSFEILEGMEGALDQRLVKLFKDVVYAEFPTSVDTGVAF